MTLTDAVYYLMDQPDESVPDDVLEALEQVDLLTPGVIDDKVSAHQNRWLVLVEGWEISGATAVGGGAVCVFDAGGRCGLLFP